MSTELALSESTPESTTVALGTITAEIRLEHDRLLLAPTLTAERDSSLSIELESQTAFESGERLYFCAVSADCFEGFETGLERDPTVTDPVLVDRYPDRRIYRVTATDHAIEFGPAVAAVGGRPLRTESHTAGWTLELRLPSREALVALNERCGEQGIRFVVNHLRVAADGEDGIVGLTAKQQYLLTVAYEGGYFDVPRGISQKELAEALNVSKSAISQRLRRAIAELCAASL